MKLHIWHANGHSLEVSGRGARKYADSWWDRVKDDPKKPDDKPQKQGGYASVESIGYRGQEYDNYYGASMPVVNAKRTIGFEMEEKE